MRKLYTFIILLSTLSILSTAKSEVLLIENFDYPAADSKLTDNGWYTQWESASELQVTNGLEFNEHPGSGIGYAACLDMRESNPLHHTFSSEVTEGAVYYSFLFQPTTVGKSSWFMALRDKIMPNDYSSFNMNARVLISVDNKIGLTFADNKEAEYHPLKQLDPQQVYLIVVKYKINDGDNNDEVSLFLFEDYTSALKEPEKPFIGPLADAAKADINPANIILRGFDDNSFVVVDGIRCGTSWTDVITPGGCNAIENNKNEETTVTTADQGVLVTSNGQNKSITIYDLLGAMVYNNSNAPEELYIPLNKGIYIIKTDNTTHKIAVK